MNSLVKNLPFVGRKGDLTTSQQSQDSNSRRNSRVSQGERKKGTKKERKSLEEKWDPQNMLAMLERQATLHSQGAEELFQIMKTTQRPVRSLDESDHVVTPKAA